MHTKMFMAALLGIIGLIVPVQAGGGHHGGGGGSFVSGRSSGARGGGPSYSSMAGRSYGGNRMMYSGQRFSSSGMRSSNGMRYHPQSVNSNFGGQRFAQGNPGANHFNRFANGSRVGRTGNGLASNNHALANHHGAGSGQFHNAQGGRLASNWKNHVVGQHSGNWHSNWSHNHSHWWHGHNWCWIGSSWFAFDVGFYPWWPWWWDYPYYSYGYGYPYGSGYNNYGYGNGYGYDYGSNSSDPGVYDGQPADQNGSYDDQSNSQNGYHDQSANSSVAGAQDRLTQEGFYHGQIDGVLGPETRHAIVRFQTKHGLRISGELSRETLDAMGLRQYANY